MARSEELTRSIYMGSCPETRLILDLLAIAERHPDDRMAILQALHLDRGMARQLQIRFQWCDHWGVFFHPDADQNSDYEHRRDDLLIKK